MVFIASRAIPCMLAFWSRFWAGPHSWRTRCHCCCYRFFVLYINQFQIKPEERVLSSLFGAEYETYRTRVRRWL